MKHEGHRPPEPPRGDLAGLLNAARELGVSLTEEQGRKLARYEDFLRRVAIPRGLIARGDEPLLRQRHVLDGLRAVPAVHPEDTKAYDLGSGAGIPGVAVAVALPRLHVRLVESRRSRVAVLEQIVEALGLDNVSARGVRIEDLRERVDVCFARALAPLSQAWRLARPLLEPGGRLVYFAGRSFRPGAELPADATNVLVEASALESSGPLVIMTRQR